MHKTKGLQMSNKIKITIKQCYDHIEDGIQEEGCGPNPWGKAKWWMEVVIDDGTERLAGHVIGTKDTESLGCSRFRRDKYVYLLTSASKFVAETMLNRTGNGEEIEVIYEGF